MKKGLLSGHATWHDPRLQHGNSTIVGILFRLEKGITTVSCQTLPFHEVNTVLGLHVEHSLGLYQLEHLHKNHLYQMHVTLHKLNYVYQMHYTS